jgi:acyl-CoA hydrolase
LIKKSKERANWCGLVQPQPWKVASFQSTQTVTTITECSPCKAQNNAGFGDVHCVVTEHGIAYLHGKTLRERAEALIAFADSHFRRELEDSAVRALYLEREKLAGVFA